MDRKTVLVRLEPEIHTALKMECVRRELTIQAACAALIERWIAELPDAEGVAPCNRGAAPEGFSKAA